MRCDEVIRELSVPTDNRDLSALANHLASCSACAEWARRDAQFDRLWKASRPDEPSAREWETVWAQIASRIDSPIEANNDETPVHAVSLNGTQLKSGVKVDVGRPKVRANPRPWVMIGFIGLAQAAAIFLVVLLNWQLTDTSRSPQLAVNSPTGTINSPSVVASHELGLTTTRVEIEEGEVVVIQFEGAIATVVDRTPQAATSKLETRLRALEGAHVDDLLLMLNEFESMTKPTVAMKE
jgi:hypothetical protein